MLIRWPERAICAAMIGMCLSQVSACAEAPKEHPLTPNDAAQSAVDALHNLEPASPKSPLDAIGFIKSLFNDPEDEEFAKELGFDSAQELADAKLGLPLRICSVDLDGLLNFQPTDDPNKLLVDTKRLIFPIFVKEQARLSITVMESEKNGKGWQVVQRGSPKVIQKIQQQNPSSSSFLLMVPPFGVRFLGNRKAGQLMLTAIDESGYLNRYLKEKEKLKPGDELPARELFARLAPRAKDLYADPKIKEKLSKGRQRETLTQGGEKC